MGTRNLTVVIASDGQTKIAQYGQWDGYPDGQGIDALRFLSNPGNRDMLEKQLDKVRFLDYEGKDKDFVAQFEKKPTPEQTAWYDKYLDRDLGASIMERVANSSDEEIVLKDSTSFGKDGVFCEWSWEVNFQTGKFTARHTYPGKAIAEFDLNNLPEEKAFLEAFTDADS